MWIRLVSLLAITPLLSLRLLGESAAAAPRSHNTTTVAGDYAPQGLDVRTLSKSVKPGDDFFTYINEGWLASTPIPEGFWDYGQTTALGITVERQIQEILDSLLKPRSPQSDVEQQVGDAYASFLDSATIEKRGLSKLSEELKQILQAKSPEDVARWMANPTSSSIVAINLYPAERQWRVHLDQQNISQPILGLPNPNDYSRTDDAGIQQRDAYRAYVAKILGLAGIDDADNRAASILTLETRIAGNFWPFEKLRDRKANYHPMSVAELKAYAPEFP